MAFYMRVQEATWRLARCTSSLCLNGDRQRTAMLERLMSSEGVVSSSFSTCFSSNKSPIELPPCKSIIHPIRTTSSASFHFVRREGQPIYKLFTTEQHSPNPDMALNIICDINIDSARRRRRYRQRMYTPVPSSQELRSHSCISTSLSVD